MRLDFSDSIGTHEMENDLCKRSWPFTDLCPGCLRFSIFNFFFSKTARLIETKLPAEPLWDGGMQDSVWDLDHMTKISDISYLVKTLSRSSQN